MGYGFESDFKYLFFSEQVSEQSEHLLPKKKPAGKGLVCSVALVRAGWMKPILNVARGLWLQ
jgi:hypothetical protein